MNVTGQETKQQRINHLTRSATQMEATPLPSEFMNFIDQPVNIYEKEYLDFIDLAAHELDAPLRKLSLLTGRLTDKFEAAAQNKEINAYVERINSCVRDMQSLVENITVLAKVTAEKREHIACNLEEIVQDVIESLRAPVKTMKTTVNMSSLPSVEGDRAQFLRLFKNIIENSIKFGSENVPPEIHIRSAMLNSEEKDRFKLPGNKVYHKIEISDNGIGFKSEYAEKIFRPFVRLHGKSKFEGNGLGLAVCRKIMENHQGVIYASSSGKGSTFVLLLPQIL